MKKHILIGLIMALLMCFCGCGGSEEQTTAETTETTTQTTTQEQTVERSIDAVADELGLTGKSETYYTVIGAKDGAEFNDGTVELYLYDPNDKNYKDIADGNGVIKAEAVNNGVILVVPEGTEPDAEIVAKFKDIVIE
jgi:hypothetical protein